MNKPVSTVLKLGSKGDDVKKVQARLIELGYSCGRTGADGIFVSGTYVLKDAVAAKGSTV